MASSKVSEKSGASKDSVRIYVVKCFNCEKWRNISTKEEYETIRHNILENPWSCNQKPGVSCENPVDMEKNNSQIWAMDKPNVPKVPPNTERMLIMRRDNGNMDTFYLMPNGKKASCISNVEKFLEEYPEYKDSVPISSFDFDAPNVGEKTVSDTLAQVAAARGKKPRRKAPANVARKKHAKAGPSSDAEGKKRIVAEPKARTTKKQGADAGRLKSLRPRA